jgi:DNA-binding protein YbaB
MSDPLSNVERMVGEWERDAEENARRYQEMQRISITESAADGAVSVTAGQNGIPSDVSMTDRVSRIRPDEIAAAVMQAMTKAQSRYPAELARIIARPSVTRPLRSISWPPHRQRFRPRKNRCHRPGPEVTATMTSGRWCADA